MIRTTTRKLFRKLGFEIRRTRAGGSAADPLIHTDEWSGLVADVEAFFSTARSGFSWNSPKEVLDYLSPKRIRQHQSVTRICDEYGIALNGRKLADAGTGVGYFLRHVSRHYQPEELWGFDMKEDDLAIAARLCPVARLERRAFEELPSGCFDVLFCMQVLEHVMEPVNVIRTLMESLRDGGSLIVTIPDGRTDNLRPGEFYPEMRSYWGHINFWSIESWKIFLEKELPETNPLVGVLPVESNNLFAILRKPGAGMVQAS